MKGRKLQPILQIYLQSHFPKFLKDQESKGMKKEANNPLMQIRKLLDNDPHNENNVNNLRYLVLCGYKVNINKQKKEVF